jgi:serine/threonine protein kinase
VPIEGVASSGAAAWASGHQPQLEATVSGTVGAGLIDDNTAELLSVAPRSEVTNAAVREIAAGSILRSRYVLEQIIGQGGDSIVFCARDLHRTSSEGSAGSYVAVKVLLPKQRANPYALARLKREFWQMQWLSHPGIVRVFDLDCDADIWFMSMELVVGQTVKTWMQTPASHAEAVRIISGCCEALQYAHSLGIVHGDLKPTNALVAEDGRVKLIDFGSAPSPGSGITTASDVGLAATPIYASPQILAGGKAERRDDIFSLACLSYSILSSGAHPFDYKSSLDASRAKLPPTYVPAIPERSFAVIERALSPERERRPTSVGEFLRDLISTDLSRCPVAASDATTSTPAGFDPGQHRSGATVPESGSLRIDALRLSGQRNEHGVATFALAATGGRVWGRRGSLRHTRSLRMLMVLSAVILGTAGLFHHTRPQNAERTVESSPQGGATNLVAAASAPMAALSSGGSAAASDVLPESQPRRHESGVISFEESTLHATAAQSLVAISVKRLQSTRGPATFTWRVERGSAQPHVDYEQVEPRTVRFIEGQSVRSLFIPLIRTRATVASRGPRSFTVALEKVAGGAALGRFDRVTVTIEPPPGATHPGIYQALADR